ncbi:hypothetical protein B0T25DRAFT_286423 [Lasiosphaeria hispida]|uniref:Uncharacterized protein n=1 Tax=Lasiosphaeria hispida TaxID=260671 RepID=A0AAJ0HBU9_9PEZI|nr:hypothetical protein B0T25DRAFT_286423 [Lasiosphaeria hispida]
MRPPTWTFVISFQFSPLTRGEPPFLDINKPISLRACRLPKQHLGHYLEPLLQVPRRREASTVCYLWRNISKLATATTLLTQLASRLPPISHSAIPFKS